LSLCQGHLGLIPLICLRAWIGFGGVVAGGDWSYVENCTVDASIF
jgi:hypothetical protein